MLGVQERFFFQTLEKPTKMTKVDSSWLVNNLTSTHTPAFDVEEDLVAWAVACAEYAETP